MNSLKIFSRGRLESNFVCSTFRHNLDSMGKLLHRQVFSLGTNFPFRNYSDCKETPLNTPVIRYLGSKEKLLHRQVFSLGTNFPFRNYSDCKETQLNTPVIRYLGSKEKLLHRQVFSLGTNFPFRNYSDCKETPLNTPVIRYLGSKEKLLHRQVFSLGTNFPFRNYSDCKETPLHTPVMKEEVLDNIGLNKDSVFLDMTFGAGGHTTSILNKYPGSKVFCLDRDPVAYRLACDLEQAYPSRVVPLLGKFSDLPDLVKAHGARQNYFDAILFDFGCSSMQFDEGGRGFSVSKDGPLDMRMDGNRFPQNPTAADVLATADEHDLQKIFKIYGEEKKAKKIARAVVEARYLFTPLQTTRELADLVTSVLVNETRTDKLDRRTHVATKIFQALRIFVNNELNEINYGILLAQRYLKIGGRLLTICFHSLEDLIVKRHITGNMTDNSINVLPLQFVDNSRWHDKVSIKEFTSSYWQPLHKHVLLPSAYEVETNPRSRSAKMRTAVRIS